MRGEGGSVDDLTIAEIAVGVRTLLTAIEAGEMTCSAAYRNRLQGAVLTLESLAGWSANNGD